MFATGVLLAMMTDPRIAQAIQSLALLLFIYYGFRISSYYFESSYFKVMFILLALWHVYVICNGLNLSYTNIKLYLFSEFTFWPFIIPFAVFIPKNISIFKKIFNCFFYLGIVFLLLVVLLSSRFKSSFVIAEQLIWTFSIGCGFILLTWKYHTPVRRLLAMFVVAVALVLATVLARRNIMLTEINFIVGAFLLFLFYYSNRKYSQKLVAFLVVAIVAASAYIVFEQKKDTDFKLIVHRASEDTREYVFDYFFDDLKHVMWIGKGMNGTYFCPLSDPDNIADPIEYRDLIECGYLQIILKGGYINLGIFLLIAIPAAYLGIVKSKNGIAKACGVIVLLWLIDMIPYGLPSFSIRYLLVWFSIGVCYSKSFRNLSEEYITTIKFINKPIKRTSPKKVLI